MNSPSNIPLPPARLNWRERYAAILILSIGIIYLLLQVFAFMSSTTNAYAFENGSFVVHKSRNELFSDIRALLTVLLAIMAGILMLRRKLTGWVIGFSMLLLFTAIAGGIILTFIKLNTFDVNFIMLAVTGFLLLCAVIFLVLPSTLKKYRVGRKTVLPTLLFFMTIASVYFFLQ